MTIKNIRPALFRDSIFGSFISFGTYSVIHVVPLSAAEDTQSESIRDTLGSNSILYYDPTLAFVENVRNYSLR